MSQYFDGNTRPDVAASALAAHLRVKTSGALVVATSSDLELGTMESACTAAGPCTVRLRTATGTAKFIANGAITINNPVYAADGGKVASSGSIRVGTSLETVTADGDVIEVVRTKEDSDAAAAGGTTAAAFLVDSDATDPKIELASVSGTGNYKVTLKPATTLTANRVVTFQDSASQVVVARDTTDTLTNKTLTSPTLNGLTKLQNTVTPVAAAGSTVSDAAVLASTTFNHITSDSAAKGVKLPTTAQNQFGWVINNSATAAEFYAASGGTVNGLSADASVVIPSSKGIFWFATAADTIIAFDLTAKASAS